MPYTAQAFRARKLRNSMTEPEVWLWGRLKRLRARGFQIRGSLFRFYIFE